MLTIREVLQALHARILRRPTDPLDPGDTSLIPAIVCSMTALGVSAPLFVSHLVSRSPRSSSTALCPCALASVAITMHPRASRCRLSVDLAHLLRYAAGSDVIGTLTLTVGSLFRSLGGLLMITKSIPTSQTLSKSSSLIPSFAPWPPPKAQDDASSLTTFSSEATRVFACLHPHHLLSTRCNHSSEHDSFQSLERCPSVPVRCQLTVAGACPEGEEVAK